MFPTSDALSWLLNHNLVQKPLKCIETDRYEGIPSPKAVQDDRFVVDIPFLAVSSPPRWQPQRQRECCACCLRVASQLGLARIHRESPRASWETVRRPSMPSAKYLHWEQSARSMDLQDRDHIPLQPREFRPRDPVGSPPNIAAVRYCGSEPRARYAA